MNEFIVVTVNYNSYSYTLALVDNLASITNQTGSAIRLVIVDNASRPENLEQLEARVSHQTWIKLIKNNHNTGYFRGLNLGLEQISNTEKNNVIICNNDITFDPTFFDLLSNENLTPGTLVVAPRVTTLDGREQNPHVVESISPFRLFCYDLYYSSYWLGCLLMKAARLNKKTTNLEPELVKKEIYMGIGACYVLTKEFFEKCTKLDERVFLWGEEALLAGQVREAHGKTMYLPSLRVYHAESASVSAIPSLESYRISQKSFKIYRQYLRR